MTDPSSQPALANLQNHAPGPPARVVQARGWSDWPRRVLRVSLTLLAVALAALLTWRTWNLYMGAPWTRDATVRAYVVTMAPQVAGRIVGLPVLDNQYVRKGDLLLEIEPTDYEIAVSQAEATVQQNEANVGSIDAQIAVQQAQIAASQAKVDEAQAALVFGKQQAARYQDLARQGYGTVQNAQQWTSQQTQQEASLRSGQASLELAQRQVVALEAQRRSAEANLAQAKAQLHQAKVNLERTRLLAPVNGYVTNLLAQVGNYVNVGVITISLVNADSFWVDGYFEETNISPIRVGDQAQIKLMGFEQVLRGHVDSVSRAINVSNAQPNDQGVATVNPIFTWVRLAQRIPVRIHIDQVPPEVTLAAGMTVTVQIDTNRSEREEMLSGR